MFICVRHTQNKFWVKDSDDGITEVIPKQQVIALLADGVAIDGLALTTVFKGFKFRLYPSKEQEVMFQKTFGCCRLVYNCMLSDKIEYYNKTGEFLTVYPSAYYTSHPFLKEVDSSALGQEWRHLNSAYTNWARHGRGCPVFKSKHSGIKSYSTLNRSNGVRFDGNFIRLPKIGLVKVVQTQPVNGQIKTVTISQVPSGKYFISMNVWVYEIAYSPVEKEIGIDLGIKNYMTLSDGTILKNIHFLGSAEKRLSREQRKLSRMKKGGSNYSKQCLKIAKLHEKIVNRRLDYIHQTTSQLIMENQLICSEDLSIRGMLKNHQLAMSITDVSWYETIRQLNYKAKWRGRIFVKVERNYPSSQLCNYCGYQNSAVRNLSVREWVCPECGVLHDRDINAAQNILDRGRFIMQQAG